jgi:hypothetical protein
MFDYGSGRELARAGVLASSLILLAACATGQGPEAVTAMPSPMAMQEVASAAPSPAIEPMPEAVPQELEPPMEVLPPPEPAPPPPPPPPPPLPTPTDAQSLRAAYGTPAFIRREPDSELWRYDGTMCAAFFFLYLDGATYRIRHSETAPRGQDMAADADCLRSLLVPAGGALPAGGM